MSDEGKAVEELAKLGQRSLETADKAGGWLDGVLGEGFRQLGGVWADNVAGFRYRNRLRVLQKTRAAIEAAGLSGTVRQLTDRVTVPLIEAISDESDETLQDVWAAYIRNAVDPAKPQPDRLLIDVIRRLEPADWSVLQVLFRSDIQALKSEDFKSPDADLAKALDRLTALGLLDFDDERSPYIVSRASNKMLTVDCLGGTYFENRLLRALGLATSSEGSSDTAP